MKYCFNIFVWLSFMFFAPFVLAQIPKTISYQGVLTDTLGNAKPDGNYAFTFRLYETETRGSAIWSEAKSVPVKKSLFSTKLGDQIPFSDNVKFDKPYWLSIEFGNDGELSPRIALAAVGYSISSINADTAKYAKQFTIVNGQVVRSINGKKDNVILKGAGGTAVTSDGDSIIITSSSGGSGSGISAIQNTDNAFSISNPTGPTATINLHSPFIVNSDVGIGVNSPAAKLDVNGGSGNGANIGIHGSSNDNYGIYGSSNNNYGLFGESAGLNGVYARTYASGEYALLAGNGLGNNNYCGLASGTYSLFANGPAAFSTMGIGAAPDQNPSGVKLNINSGSSTGINVTSSNYAMYALGSAYFSGTMGIGVTSPASKLDVNGGSGNGANIGIHGSSNDSYGIYGSSNSSLGVFGESGTSSGVYAKTYNKDSFALYAINSTNSDIVCALASGINAIYAAAPIALDYAGRFVGDVVITNDLTLLGSFYSGSIRFKIDHPLDPENKYLSHSSVESPEMMNIYSGNVITDANGSAIVNLPSYFQALNIDYRYQLTVMGQFAQAIVENEISNNQFTIRTDKPNVKVSWQVTGIRHDAYAKAHPMEVEEEKAPNDRGKYLTPELYGQPEEKGINYISKEQLNNMKEHAKLNVKMDNNSK